MACLASGDWMMSDALCFFLQNLQCAEHDAVRGVHFDHREIPALARFVERCACRSAQGQDRSVLVPSSLFCEARQENHEVGDRSAHGMRVRIRASARRR